ncbi:carboxyl transferase domain-containing protein [Nonomuraea sp. NPDC052129]|uniref:acyl-CoA carboxylase subunit beta n=1 Tax=Nonomuraea sp. NPDC052129 TaxID=3154651 RepID=UPI0034262E2E
MTATPITQEHFPLDQRAPAVRLARLLDADSVVPLHDPDASGVSAASGRIGGHKVITFCTDPANMGGALGAAGCDKIVSAIDAALLEGCPVIGLWHSGGARLADGVESMDGVGRMFAAMTRASGRVPQISVILGPAAGAAAYGPALTDVVIMSKAGRMFVTGPDVVRSVTGEQIDMESLGGAETHSRKSGVAHIVVDSESDAYEATRQVTLLLAHRARIEPHLATAGKDLRALLPERARRAYDVRPLVREILDEGTPFMELQPRWAPNVVVGLGRLTGGSVGVIANNPLRMGGCLDSLSAEKASRFVRMCNAFGIPLIVLVDVPGYLPGVTQEWGGVVRRGAKLLHAFAEAAVPRVTLVTRQSYGGAYIAMNSRSLGASAVFAWPEAKIAVMSAEAAVGILHRKRLAAAHDDDERAELRQRLVAEHTLVAGGVARAVALGVVDEVIDPAQTRPKLAMALAAASAARGRHGNIPL